MYYTLEYEDLSVDLVEQEVDQVWICETTPFFQHDPSHPFGLSQINGHKSEPESPKKELIVEEEVAHKKPRNEEDLPDFILQAGNLRYLWDTVQDYNQDHESSRESVITERDMKRVLIFALSLSLTHFVNPLLLCSLCRSRAP